MDVQAMIDEINACQDNLLTYRIASDSVPFTTAREWAERQSHLLTQLAQTEQLTFDEKSQHYGVVPKPPPVAPKSPPAKK